MHNQSDGQLMSHIRERRKDSLEQLYDRHARLVYSFAIRIAGNENLAREIVQLVFARIWTTKAKYDADKGVFTSWLITMTRHISIDVLRRERRHQSVVSIDDLEESLGSTQANSPEALAIHNDQRTAIAVASKRLSEPQQKVIELLYWKGYTLQEIAEMGGEPLGTVKSRLHQALKTLRRLLHGIKEER